MPFSDESFGVARTWSDLAAASFMAQVNAWCWPRTLVGDFGAIARAAGEIDGITTLEEDDLMSLELDGAGREARTILIEDLRRCREAGLDPSLDLIPEYPREAAPGPVPLDVYGWHVDRAPADTDTWLCSYTVAASQGLRPEDAVRCVDQPETRAVLRAEFGAGRNAEFEDWLVERCYDLHFEARAGVEPYDFGLGHFWRVATQGPDGTVPACVHRAPRTRPGQAPRLLLIC